MRTKQSLENFGNIISLPSKIRKDLKEGKIYGLFQIGDPAEEKLFIFLTKIGKTDCWGKRILPNGKSYPIFFRFLQNSKTTLSALPEKKEKEIMVKYIKKRMAV